MNVTGSQKTMSNVEVSVSAFMAFKCGKARGDYSLTVQPETPDKLLEPSSVTITFKGDDDGYGINIITSFSILVSKDGLYWFNILLNDKFMTKVPLRVIYKYEEAQDLVENEGVIRKWTK